MKVILIALVVFCSLSIRAQTWQRVGPLTGDDLYGITSTPDSTYYAASFNPARIYRSTNGGTAWIPIFTLPGSLFRDIEFVTNQIGFVSGADISSNPPKGVIYKTIDGGNTWLTSSIPNSGGVINGNITDIHFENINEGYAVGHLGVVLKTTNQGSNWAFIPFYSNGHLFSMERLGQDSIWASGNNGLFSIYPNRAPQNLISNHVSGISKGINDIFTIDDNNFIRYQNGTGLPIRLASNPLSNSVVKKVLALSDSLIFIAGDDRNIYFSNDGGQTFNLETTPVNNFHIFDLKLLNGYVWAAGVSGTILRRQLTVGEKEHLQKANELRLYPNPAKDFVWIKKQESIDEVRVLDIKGKEILSSIHPSNKFDISQLIPGIYIMQVISDGKVSTKKFIKH